MLAHGIIQQYFMKGTCLDFMSIIPFYHIVKGLTHEKIEAQSTVYLMKYSFALRNICFREIKYAASTKPKITIHKDINQNYIHASISFMLPLLTVKIKHSSQRLVCI